MKPLVYIETSIPSYLTARPSRDVVGAGRQQITLDWWKVRDRFQLFVSDAVLVEAGRGDHFAARLRLQALDGIPILAPNLEAEDLTIALLREAGLPAKAEVDAGHIAIAAVHGMEYLLTWNCRHIANVMLRPQIEAVCRDRGFLPPLICTPEEFFFEEES